MFRLPSRTQCTAIALLTFLFAFSAFAKPRIVFVLDLDEMLISSDLRKLNPPELAMLDAQGLLLRVKANGKIYRIVHGARELPHALRSIDFEDHEVVIGVFSSHSRSDRTKEIVQSLWSGLDGPSFVLTHDDLTIVDPQDPTKHGFRSATLTKKKDLRKVPGWTATDIVFLIDDEPGHSLGGQGRSFVRVRKAEESDIEIPRVAGLFLQAAETARETKMPLAEVVLNFQWYERQGTYVFRTNESRDRYYTHLGRQLLSRSASRHLAAPPPAQESAGVLAAEVAAPPPIPVSTPAPGPAPVSVPVPVPTMLTVPVVITPSLLDVLAAPMVGLTVGTPGGLQLRLLQHAHHGPRFSVWRAELASGVQVAVKINRAGPSARGDLAADARYGRRLVEKEFGELVAKVFESGDDYVIKEWVDGETGAEFIAAGPMDLPGTLFVQRFRELVAHSIRTGRYVRLLEPGHVAVDRHTGKFRILRNGGVLDNLSRREVEDQYRRNFDKRWVQLMAPGCGDKLTAAVLDGV